MVCCQVSPDFVTEQRSLTYKISTLSEPLSMHGTENRGQTVQYGSVLARWKNETVTHYLLRICSFVHTVRGIHVGAQKLNGTLRSSTDLQVGFTGCYVQT
jgi:hypothetical protein